MKARHAALIALVAALLVMQPSDSPGCGPFFQEVVFTSDYHPGPTAEELAAGRLGVIQPRYWRRYLLVAYRYLAGEPLTEDERQAFLGRDGQAGGEYVRIGARMVPREIGEWLEARAEYGGGEAPEINPMRQVPESQWQWYQNCGVDAFASAARTLRARSGEFGPAHLGVREWIKAQDTVFSNCEGGAVIPAEAAASLPEKLRQDRDYQIAAAHFYAGDLHEAQRRFATIADDNASPWRDIAPYLVARCMIRRATLDPRPGHADLDLLSRAAHQLREILADPSRTSVHGAATRMLHHLAARLQPGERLMAIAAEISGPDGAGAFRQNLIDFQMLMERDAQNSAEVRARGELADWVVTFQDRGPGARDHAIERWRATRSPQWLVAAIDKTSAGDPATAELLEAASSVSSDAPAFGTVSFHRVRLMMEGGRNAEAREELDRLLPVVERTQPAAAWNRFRGLRMKLASSFDEFLAFAPRRAMGTASEGAGQSSVAALPEGAQEFQLDGDSIVVFNQGLPLEMIVDAAGNESLPEEVRQDLAEVAFVRAILLGEEMAVRALLPRIERAHPTLQPQLRLYGEAPDEAHRRFAAAFVLLKAPGLRPNLVRGIPTRTRVEEIDDFRDNWWCGFEVGPDLHGRPLARHHRSSWPSSEPPAAAPPAAPEFLTGAQRDQFQQEWERLTADGSGVNHLAAVVSSFAEEHPGNELEAEALHLAVRATRYGCTDKATSRQSRRAFQLLHRRHPDSAWAKQTPYWY